ncbi:TPA: hypothetical protein N0F65_009155 [Lagenidium giganteum]|uniref:Phospholipid/glycerol acyltransferase domain-containing protein n=1 Tax=Lagenidium giganteum TaxID=4803 RepID=A0AAV2YTJ1_9STRA|nr:TPA: hypothetical protein N0F65_009155 [Lagenidium giganteum]
MAVQDMPPNAATTATAAAAHPCGAVATVSSPSQHVTGRVCDQPEPEPLLNRAVMPDVKYETDGTLLQSIAGKLYVLLLVVAALLDMMFFILPLKFVLRPLVLGNGGYQRCMRVVEGLFFAMMAGLLEVVGGLNMVITTDADDTLRFEDFEHVLLIANHRTEIDWIFFWNLALRLGYHDRIRVMLKAAIRFVPGPGWAMLLLDFPYVNRDWASDQQKIKTQVQAYSQTKQSTWLAMFPEGTALYSKTLKQSQEFARAHGNPEWNYVLQPRVRGFELCWQVLNPEWVVDLTMAYPELADGVRPSPLRLFRGQIPREVHVHVKRYHREDMRQHAGDGDIGKWVKTRFAEKEKLLQQFYEHKSFEHKQSGPCKRATFKHGTAGRAIAGLSFHVALIAFTVYLWMALPTILMSSWFLLSFGVAIYFVKTF